jgi:peptide/nickel transport system permease protein
MTIYIIRRFLQSLIFIVLGALTVYTVVVLLMPTGPKFVYDRMIANFREMVPEAEGTPRSPETDAIIATYKIDKPWPLNFAAWLFDPSDTTHTMPVTGEQVPKGIDLQIGGFRLRGSGILTGDFGVSRWVGRGGYVGDMIQDNLGNTVLLTGTALALTFAIAIPVGVLSAVQRRSTLAHALTFGAIAGRSVPPFALGLVFVILFAVIPYQLNTQGGVSWLPYLPPGEPYDLGKENDWVNRAYHLVLPALTLAIVQIVWLSRFVRSAMLEVLGQDYIRTARAKGLTGWQVNFKHALRNASLPIITVLGLMLPGLVSGAIVIENVFSYQGLGQLYYRSLGGTLVVAGGVGLGRDEIPPVGGPLDVPLVLALTLMLIAVVAFSNMLADVLYAVADPRVSYGRTART